MKRDDDKAKWITDQLNHLIIIFIHKHHFHHENKKYHEYQYLKCETTVNDKFNK